MSHVATQSAYSRLIDRLNRFPQGAPASDLLYRILRMMFSEREASLVAELPIRPFTARKAAKIWKRPEAEASSILDTLADRGILLDAGVNGKTTYTLPPPMAGFFEFSMMRVRQDIDQKVLAELFYQYLNVEEDFIRDLFTRGETQLGRVFVHEPALSPSLTVLDYERASEVIRTASHRAVGTCYCRHKMHHLGRACDAPMEICMTFNSTADSLIRHGIARSIDEREGSQSALEVPLEECGDEPARFAPLPGLTAIGDLPVAAEQRAQKEEGLGCGGHGAGNPAAGADHASALDRERPVRAGFSAFRAVGEGGGPSRDGERSQEVGVEDEAGLMLPRDEGPQARDEQGELLHRRLALLGGHPLGGLEHRGAGGPLGVVGRE